ncbi:MAG TPA: cupredoxin family protein [Burkholderiales bacterium]|nr:cupredoxin family protein [Burkholderiales bacterium]
MKTSAPLVCAFAIALATAAAASLAHDDQPTTAHANHPHDAGTFSDAGQPGKPSAVTRTIRVRMLDSMRFDPSSITVKTGDTVRFVAVNEGRLRHEFGIGTHEEQLEHDEMMKVMPDMVHDDPNVVTLEPGQTRELIWQFTKPGTFEIACHTPGHYPAGMKMSVRAK